MTGCSLLALPARAGAQTETPKPVPPPAPSADRRLEEGRRHFEQGVALFEERNFTGALAEFSAAYDIAPASTIQLNIGLTYKAMFRYPEAVETLERALVEAAVDGKLAPERRAQVRALIDEMRALLAPVTFTLTPSTATVMIDGRLLVLPGNNTVSLAAGTHQIDVSAMDHQPQRQELTVRAGVPARVEMRLAAIPRTGKVRVTSSRPNTRISVDGQARGIAPLELELPAGGHQLEARADGFEDYRSELMLAAGQERNVDVELRRPPPGEAPIYKRWWFWTGLGTAVAGGTVAAFLLQPGTKAPTVGTLDPGGQNVSR